MQIRLRATLITAASALITSAAVAAQGDQPSTSPMKAFDNGPIVFSAPPRESVSVGEKKYGPVAKYLSQVLGKQVVYKHPGTWGVYRAEMLKGNYDILFDGPHFNSYRVEKLGHNILVKIPKQHEFVVFVKSDKKKYSRLEDLAGRTFCTHAPPNLGTLTLLSQFSNPARQPAIVNTKGWDNIYKGVMSGRCVAGIIPILNLNKLDPQGRNARIVFHAETLPNQAFSAGPRISPEDQKKIAEALSSPAAAQATASLRSAYKVGKAFAKASNPEYVGVSKFLKNEWGYY